jgi:hypothetical protein
MKSERKYYPISGYGFLRNLHYSKLFALSVHWVFQNMINMDSTELIFKLSIDLFFTLLFSLILTQWLFLPPAIAIGFFLAHSINFLFNSQIFVVLKFFGGVKHELAEFDEYIASIQTRLLEEPSIRWGAIYGSMARGELKTTSDLDIRFIRYPGIYYGLRSCWFVLKERSRAHINRFPIDFLVFDSPRLLYRLRPDEPPIIIHER